MYSPAGLSDKASETEAITLSRKGYVIVETEDWNVIPLENLVSMSDRVIALVKDFESAELALKVLEKGVCGILLSTTRPCISPEGMHRLSTPLPPRLK